MSNIRVELQLEDGSFTSGVYRAGQSLESFRKELARTNPHFRDLERNGQGAFVQFKKQEEQAVGLTRRFRDLTIGIGAAGVAFATLSGASNGMLGNIIRINAEMEKLKYQLAGMSTAADPMAEAAQQVRQLSEFAAEVPFSLGAITSSFVKLKAAGIEPMNGSLQALTNGLAAFGASDEQFNRVTVAITQMQGKGVVSMEELRQQLGESMPSAMKLMARSMGVSVGELTKLVSTGTVESRSALDKWFKELDRTYGGTASLMMESFTGQLAKINTAFRKLATEGQMGKAFEQLKSGMGDLAEYLDTDDARQLFDTLGVGLQHAVTLMESFVAGLGRVRDIISFLGPVLPALFGGAAVVGGMSALLKGLDLIRRRYQMVSTSAKDAGHALRNMIGGAQAGVSSGRLGAIADAGEAATAAALLAADRGADRQAQGRAAAVARNGNKIFGPLVAGASRFLGLLGPIGLGIGILGPIAWEVGKGIMSWGDNARDAARSIADEASDSLDDLRGEFDDAAARIQSRIQRLQIANAQEMTRYGGPRQSVLDQNYAVIAQYEQQLAALTNEFTQDQIVLAESAAKARFEAIEKELVDPMRELSREYDRRQTSVTENRDAAMVAAEQNGQNPADIRRQAQEDLLENQRWLAEERIKLWDAEIAKMREHTQEGVDQTTLLTLAEAERVRLQAQLADIRPEQMTVQLLTAPESDEKKMDRLTTRFNNARDAIAEMSAEMGGASGEVAKLMYQMRRGDFGKIEHADDNLKSLMDSLIQTTIEAEALEAAMNQIDKAESAVESVIERLNREALEARAYLDGVNVDDEVAFLTWQQQNAVGVFEGIAESGAQTFDHFTSEVTRGIDTTITAIAGIGEAIRTEGFGDTAIQQINAAEVALGRVRSTTAGINQALLDINFGNLIPPAGVGVPRQLGPVPQLVRSSGNVLLDTIAAPESGGDYNATLDNGRWTNGSQNLVQMTLREILALQQNMRTPENRALYGNGQGSSALGRYQIVGNTLAEAMGQLGLTGDELFDEDMQDMIALHLARQTGGNVDRLRSTWVGLNNVNATDITSAYANGIGGPVAVGANRQETASVVGAAQDDIVALADEMRRQADETALEVARANRQRALVELDTAGRAAIDEDGGRRGTNERAARAFIEDPSSKIGDLTLPEIRAWADAYIETARLQDVAIETAREADKAAAEAAKSELALAETRAEHAERRQNALARADNRYYVEESDDLRELNAELEEQLTLLERIHGGRNNDAYRSAAADTTARYAAARAAVISADSAEALEQLTRAAEEANRDAVQDERTRRRMEFEERVHELDALRDQAIRDGSLVADAERQHALALSGLRKSLSDEEKTSLQRTTESMRKLRQNMNDSTADWATGLSDGIYGVLNGEMSEGDALKAFGLNISQSITRSLSDAAAGFLMEPIEQMLGGKSDGTGGIGGMFSKMLGLDGDWMGSLKGMLGGMMKSVGGWMSSLFSKSGFFPVKHTGGIVGAGGGWGRSAAVANFVGAPKFHTGGIVGGSGPKFRTGLLPSEVPIIAQKGEGVFTADQMKHLGGSVNSSSISISAPITVNASGGTQEQNADLARQMARESEAMFRGIVQQELVRQMRPGGMMR